MRRWTFMGATLVGLSALAASLVAATPAAAIVGGTEVADANFPYFAKVRSYFADGYSDCGGSLVSADRVLTAAHCVLHNGAVSHNMRIDIGTDDSMSATVLVHPLYNGDTADGHDLALIQLPAAPTAHGTVIQVGAPWDWVAYAAGTQAWIMGHGASSTGGPTSLSLRAAQTVLRSDDDMGDLFDPWYWFGQWLDQLMIGAGRSGQTVCVGDSGGPLVVDRGHPVQVGVASRIPHDECDSAAGFSELSGPQLAWVASQVPSVVTGWGGCQTSTGSPGQPAVAYQGAAFPGAQSDGPNSWSIWCVGQPATVSVPDVGGLTKADARATLQSVGLDLGAVSSTVDASCESINRVMHQSPPPYPASTIAITLGLRPKTPCP